MTESALQTRIEQVAGRVGRSLGLDETFSDQIESANRSAPKDVPTGRGLAPFIDHTLLKPDATAQELSRLCREAIDHSFAAVCVNPSFVPLCAEALEGTGVKVCSVIGFPLGATSTDAKSREAEIAVAAGADELDMVLQVGRLRAGELAYVLGDIRSVVKAADGRAVKVILETCLLDDDEKIAACVIARAAGAAYVKTSTGFASSGATASDIALMRAAVGDELGVKAAGGIRTAQAAREMLAAGASRIGASASVAIVTSDIESG